MQPVEFLPFQTRSQLCAWLEVHHATSRELWVRVYKKQSGTPSVTWEDCVVACLAWGWIDGQKQALDDVSFLQRLTPRRAKSNWSKKNCEHAERLIAQGHIQPSGLLHVLAAKGDGRWANAYAGSAQMVLPDDFLAVLDMEPEARAFFDTLSRSSLFSIYHRIHTAKRPQTRANRINEIMRKLKLREPF